MRARYQVVKDVMPGSHCRNNEMFQAVEVAICACTNVVPVTRNRSVPSLSGPHSLTQTEIASWKPWSRSEGDLSEPENKGDKVGADGEPGAGGSS
jgi:hypothetical protein